MPHHSLDLGEKYKVPTITTNISLYLLIDRKRGRQREREVMVYPKSAKVDCMFAPVAQSPPRKRSWLDSVGATTHQSDTMMFAPPSKAHNIYLHGGMDHHKSVNNALMDQHNSLSAMLIQQHNQQQQQQAPLVRPPTLSMEALKALSKKRAQRSGAIAARILAESRGPARFLSSPPQQQQQQQPPPTKQRRSSPPPLSIQTLKDMSTKRARASKDIAARIMAQHQTATVTCCDYSMTRFPCPAKKMGPAHNKTTAYFDIPPNSAHGMPLICSHALCRKGRLKFVYCTY